MTTGINQDSNMYGVSLDPVFSKSMVGLELVGMVLVGKKLIGALLGSKWVGVALLGKKLVGDEVDPAKKNLLFIASLMKR